MDENTESSCVPEHLEIYFAELFHDVISNVHDLKNSEILENVKSALRYMTRLKYETDNLHNKMCSSFKRPQVRCAYLNAYSVLHSIMVYSEFSNLLKESKIYSTRPAYRRDSLKICCLGGGPGIEAVAICRSICDTVFEPGLLPSHNSISVHVTMVDKHPLWRREQAAVVNAANDSSNVLHSKGIILHSDFMKADILEPFEKILREKIKEADIVTVVRLAASVQDDDPDSCDGEQLIENITGCMRKDGCLFVLDTAGGEVFSTMVKCLKDKRNHSFMKASSLKEYKLDVRTIRKFGGIAKLKEDPYHHPVPVAKGEASACMWVKKEDSVPSVNKAGTSSVASKRKEEPSVVRMSRAHPDISSGGLATPSDTAQSTEPVEKNKCEMKKNRKETLREKRKREINKQALSRLLSMIILTMILRGRSCE